MEVPNTSLVCIDVGFLKCSSCGYDKSIAALDFHHLDPSKKENNLTTFFHLNRPKNNILHPKTIAELDKCVLLCANCHRELHNED